MLLITHRGDKLWRKDPLGTVMCTTLSFNQHVWVPGSLAVYCHDLWRPHRLYMEKTHWVVADAIFLQESLRTLHLHLTLPKSPELQDSALSCCHQVPNLMGPSLVSLGAEA